MAAPTRITVSGGRAYVPRADDAVANAPEGEYIDAQSYDELSAAHYCALEAVAEDPGKWSFQTLVHIAELILDSDYPAECFTGKSGESGSVLVVRLREAIDAIDVASFPSPAPTKAAGRPSGPGGDQYDGRAAMRAALRAMSRVRDGFWVKGAPTHVLAEFLDELRADGWELSRTTTSPEPVVTDPDDTAAFTDREGSGEDPSLTPAGGAGSDPVAPAGGNHMLPASSCPSWAQRFLPQSARRDRD